MYYIGLDIHKKTISFCIKDAGGLVHQQGKVAATRSDLDTWMKMLPQPWTAAMEATIFTGWIYDHLKPHAAAVKVAHPLRSCSSHELLDRELLVGIRPADLRIRARHPLCLLARKVWEPVGTNHWT
jgi:hypothetical protein